MSGYEDEIDVIPCTCGWPDSNRAYWVIFRQSYNIIGWLISNKYLKEWFKIHPSGYKKNEAGFHINRSFTVLPPILAFECGNCHASIKSNDTLFSPLSDLARIWYNTGNFV